MKTATTNLYTLSLHDALPIYIGYKSEGILPLATFQSAGETVKPGDKLRVTVKGRDPDGDRSEEHTSELQSRGQLVCRLLLEKKKNRNTCEITNERKNTRRTAS